VFCGRHLLAAKLRPSNIDGSAGAVEEVARIVAQIRARWPRTCILLRADSGFACEALMPGAKPPPVSKRGHHRCDADRSDFGESQRVVKKAGNKHPLRVV
jgi:hypothetical protein